MNDLTVNNFFFLSVKSKYYKEQKGPEVPRSTQDVNKRGPKESKQNSRTQEIVKDQPAHKQTQKPYLLPIQVKKSKTEFMLSTL